jgi:GNAT superfamily N-acetyltransferase
MIDVGRSNRQKLFRLFQAYEWNYLPDAILEGTTGRAIADDADDPHVAVLEASNPTLSIVGGDAGHPSARQYIEQLPKMTALFFGAAGWEDLVRRIHGGKLIEFPRYAFTSEALDIEHLRELGSRIPGGYRIAQMDLDLARRVGGEKSAFAEDHILLFDSPEDFIERGFGLCLLHGDQIAAVATTFAICHKGIEIQINTREEHQRKGLATVAAAHLILHSLERNLDPNWDAANESSVGLATKLGYTPQGTYPMILYTGSRILTAVARAGLKAKEFLER